ncbi:MAG: hypothetical protein A3F13_05345 [Gammaproteobacteria bacterium RIFCSPHIGHO2_12_FULL_40_19]|nr:MAG: hypothetical protein A3F13_05345 [Gammaproteobacteria bacterium RIFCSPHIGHO2_12_FULL_40_19]
MTKKIKRVSELPEWFQLNNYKKARDMSMHDWHVQLVFRKHCLTCKISALAEPIKIMREKTVISLSDHDYFNLWYQIDKKMNLEKYVTTQENPAISSLTMRNFFNIGKFLRPERTTYQPELTDYIIDVLQAGSSGAPGITWVNTSDAYLNSLNVPNQEWLNEPIYKSASPELQAEGLINVNLDFSDDVLIEQFKKWLLTMRAEPDMQMKGKAIKQSDLNSWVLYGVLPCLDLKIWEREMSMSIPNRVMADAIYQTGVGGEETVRKTTAPLIEHLLSEKSLNLLGGLISLQKPEQSQA